MKECRIRVKLYKSTSYVIQGNDSESPPRTSQDKNKSTAEGGQAVPASLCKAQGAFSIRQAQTKTSVGEYAWLSPVISRTNSRLAFSSSHFHNVSPKHFGYFQ